MKDMQKAIKDRVYRAYGVFIITCLLTACSHVENMLPGDYVSYMEQPAHGMRKKVVVGNLEYTIQLATPAYMISKEQLKANGSVDEKIFNERVKELEGHSFFLVFIGGKMNNQKVAPDNDKNPAISEKMVTYFQQSAAADLRLKYGDKELTPDTYQFENNYGLTPYNTLIVGFETADAAGKDLEFLFNDRYHNNPMIRAEFTAKDIADLPKISLK